MRKETEPNEQAFTGNGATGLTKREFFAALSLASMALQGYLAHSDPTVPAAEAAVHSADELIIELNKEKVE